MITKRWNPDPMVRQERSDYPLDTHDAEIVPVMYNAVGGGTILFGGTWLRATPSDFEVRTRDGVADDWPISYEQLAPYYQRTFDHVAVSGLAGDPAIPSDVVPPTPALPIGAVGLRAARGMNELGWHWWPASQALASRPHGEMAACEGWGTCGSGCPVGAKASADIAVWREALRHGARLVTHARVREVTTTSGNGRATGAIYIGADGREHHATASVVVLAANGVGTPRLLLNSATARFPEGLANSSGLVGRRLMMHPYVSIRGVFTDAVETWTGPWGNKIYSMEFYETDQSRGFVRGAKWGAQPTAGPLFALSGYDYAEVGGADELDVPQGSPWGQDIHDYVRSRVGHTLSWDIIIDDLPDTENRVTLSPHLRDADGIPAPKISYKNSANTEAMIAFHVARAKEAMDAAGAVETEVYRIRACGWHLLGTARMGADRNTSVVNEYGRAHDVENLFIVDGSTFVTSTGVNPTATIAALALRTAEHLVQTRNHQEVPI
jgi:choline dehydrogenase-like flavoprotein